MDNVNVYRRYKYKAACCTSKKRASRKKKKKQGLQRNKQTKEKI